jgi:carbamoyl-phosphate synthase small subunit
MRALLAIEDGSIYPGRAFGSVHPAGAEVVVNTSVTGFQEVITDPANRGRIIVFTAPQVGNCGIQAGHDESARAQVAGVVVREACESPSHPASRGSLGGWLREQGLFGLTEVDTRGLALRLRGRGSMRGWLTTLVSDASEAVALAREVPPAGQVNAVPVVTAMEAFEWNTGGDGDRPRVALLDYGVKYGLLRELEACGCRPVVVPAAAPAREILALGAAGLVLSGGPGDPRALADTLPQVRTLIETLPTLAVGLGHQLAGLAFGARIVRLPAGHHGSNHPVQDLRTGHVLITAQNHDYAVDAERLPPELTVTHRSLNDGTLEGFQHRTLPIWGVQYRPEGAPGPREAGEIFDTFSAAIGGRRALGWTRGTPGIGGGTGRPPDTGGGEY